MDEQFSDREFLNRLDHLVFLSRRIHGGGKGGGRRGRGYGSGLEYADHREYNSGDDMRYIDWDLYGRSGKLYTKLYVEDEDLNIYILTDRSRSMAAGMPQKLKYARTLSAALGYVGLSRLDRVGAACFSDGIDGILPPRKGKNQVFQHLEFLSGCEASRATDLNSSLEAFASTVNVPGLAVILSDFLDGKGYERGLNYLLYRKFEVHVIQILSRQELHPPFRGDVRLQSMERDGSVDVHVDDAALKSYEENLGQYNERLRSFCSSRGILYQGAMTDTPFDRLLTEYFQRQL